MRRTTALISLSLTTLGATLGAISNPIANHAYAVGEPRGMLDSSQLEAAAPKPQASATPRTMTKRSSANPAPKLVVGDEKKLKNSISGFSVIISRTPPGRVRDKLVLDRAQTYLALAQSKVLSAKSEKIGLTQAVRDLVKYSQQDAMTVYQQAPTPGAQGNTQARALACFYMGLGSDFINQVDAATQWFRESLKLDPNSVNAGWMGFYIAESLFENRKFREAIDNYRYYYKYWNARTQRLVNYKLAWAYINIDQTDQAQNYFIFLIRQSIHDDIETDAQKDLAFLMTKFRTEDQILEVANTVFRTDEERLVFLRIVFDQQEAQGLITGRSKIFAKLQEVEKDPVQRIKLKIRALNTVGHGYASAAYFNTFQDIQKTVEKEGLKPRTPAFEPINAPLASESEHIIRTYVDTFSGKIKTSEKTPHAELGNDLKSLFAFYDRYFPDSLVRESVFSLWLDVCIDLKDYVCINQVSLEIAADKRLQKISARAQLERLAALEQLVKTDPKKYMTELLSAASAFVKVHTESPSWLQVAKRLVELQIEQKDTMDAIELMDRIFIREPNQENFYRLQWARFSNEAYELILGDTRGKGLKDKPDPRLADIYRESSLKMALNARKAGDKDKYASQIQTFMKLSDDPKKKAIARHDYVTFLMEKGEREKVVGILVSLDPTSRCAADYSGILHDLSVAAIKAADFRRVLELIPPGVCGGSPDLPYLRFLAELSSSPTTEPSKIQNLSGTNRDYILGVLGLTQPSLTIAFFRKYPPATPQERAVALVALRLAKGVWAFKATPKERQWLQDLTPTPAAQEAPLFPVEEKIASISFPKTGTKKSAKRFSKELTAIVKMIPAIRESIASTIKGQPPEVQYRILSSAAAMESTTADTIINSPIPAELTEEQLPQYKTGIANLAKGYSDQAAEDKRLADLAKKVIDDAHAQVASELIGVPDQNNWPWPSQINESSASGFKSLLGTKMTTAQLIVADVNRDEMLKGDKDYYFVRTGILLYGNQSAVMQKYLFQELNEHHQEDVLKKWKDRVK